ncbi:MAG: DUF1465 family protein [Alphaproteobacteria bacterium]|jgi:regulator of CtrA degradation|nr:DUF1465 family protein [Alphaproteobacteria bacterium]
MIENSSESATVAQPAFFASTYEEAFQLVLEARHYLGERSRPEVTALGVEATLAYSVESMRMTARLTQVMAWLMAMRAAHEGELSRDELSEERWRLGGHEVCLADATQGTEALPAGFRDLIERSERLFVRISRLDRLSAGEAA